VEVGQGWERVSGWERGKKREGRRGGKREQINEITFCEKSARRERKNEEGEARVVGCR